MNWQDFFNAFGHHMVTLDSVDSLSLEEIYQAFRDRLMSEVYGELGGGGVALLKLKGHVRK